jgi:hypothetical protein
MLNFNFSKPFPEVVKILDIKFPGFVKYATSHTQYATSKVKKYNINEIRQYLIERGCIA